jgi:hypothetical protein
MHCLHVQSSIDLFTRALFTCSVSHWSVYTCTVYMYDLSLICLHVQSFIDLFTREVFHWFVYMCSHSLIYLHVQSFINMFTRAVFHWCVYTWSVYTCSLSLFCLHVQSFSGADEFELTPVGDGNLNDVIRAKRPGQSVILKRAPPYIKVSTCFCFENIILNGQKDWRQVLTTYCLLSLQYYNYTNYDRKQQPPYPPFYFSSQAYR